jgi:hypothetical protein
MSGVKGQRGRPRKEGPRSPSGRLRSHYRDLCQCGKWKSKKAVQCRACRACSRPITRKPCACGRHKSYGAIRCQACESHRRWPDPQIFLCEWCGQTCQRKNRRDAKHDARRFCSKRCSGALRTAEAKAAQQTIRQAHSIQRELERAQRQYARSVCACGAAVTRSSRSMCSACWREYSRRWHPLTAKVEHLCPNCGQSFQAPEGRVFCSRRCGVQISKTRDKVRRYPSIGRLPVEDRNHLAALIALTRAANRRIDESAKSL